MPTRPSQGLKRAAENAHDKVWGLNWAEAGRLGTKVGNSGFFRKSRDILGAYLGFFQNYSWQHCACSQASVNMESDFANSLRRDL